MKRLSALLLCCLSPLALAQSDTSFTYQGELKVDGAPASGQFDLQVCLYAVPSAGAALSCASDVENLPISDGRFTLALDFGIPFDASPRYLELRVRGGAESTPHLPLQPRQALRPTPTAQFAARAPFTGLTGIPPTLLDGDDVGVTQVATGAGLTGGPITTSGTIAIAPGGINASMLAANAVGAAQIDPTQVQARISGSCAEGEYFRGFTAAGTPQCALLPVHFDRIVESSLEYGEHVRVVVRGDGRPLLAYHENGAGSMRIYNCADPACSSGNGRNLATAGDPGEGIAMVLRPDGRALIAYIDDASDALQVYSCGDANCSVGTTSAADTAARAGSIDMALRADGRAVIVYRSSATALMRTWHCANIDCTSGTAQEHNTYPTGVAIAIRPDGRPLLAAGGNAGSADSPRFWDCADAACTSGTQRPTTGVQYQEVKGMRLRSDGRALLLTTQYFGTASIVACSDVNCTAATATTVAGCVRTVDADVAMRADGTAVVACATGDAGYSLVLHDCTTASCSSGSARELLPAGRAGPAVAVALRSDDRPVAAYQDAPNLDVGIYVCATTGCP
jgi:hypothetical protein